MDCTVNEMRTKEIINIKNGQRLGFVSDAVVDLETGKLTALVVPGSYKVMGIFGRENDTVIKWEHIETIGEDLIIVSY